MELSIGLSVEVEGDPEDGFGGAWSCGRITAVREGVASVEYDEFIDEDGRRMVEEIPLARLRPSLPDDSPSVAVGKRVCGEAVDCWAKDCWWEGFVFEAFDSHVTVAFLGELLRPGLSPGSAEDPYVVHPLEQSVVPDGEEAPLRLRTSKRWLENSSCWQDIAPVILPGAGDHRSKEPAAADKGISKARPACVNAAVRDLSPLLAENEMITSSNPYIMADILLSAAEPPRPRSRAREVEASGSSPPKLAAADAMEAAASAQVQHEEEELPRAAAQLSPFDSEGDEDAPEALTWQKPKAPSSSKVSIRSEEPRKQAAGSHMKPAAAMVDRQPQGLHGSRLALHHNPRTPAAGAAVAATSSVARKPDFGKVVPQQRLPSTDPAKSTASKSLTPSQAHVMQAARSVTPMPAQTSASLPAAHSTDISASASEQGPTAEKRGKQQRIVNVGLLTTHKRNDKPSKASKPMLPDPTTASKAQDKLKKPVKPNQNTWMTTAAAKQLPVKGKAQDPKLKAVSVALPRPAVVAEQRPTDAAEQRQRSTNVAQPAEELPDSEAAAELEVPRKPLVTHIGRPKLTISGPAPMNPSYGHLLGSFGLKMQPSNQLLRSEEAMAGIQKLNSAPPMPAVLQPSSGSRELAKEPSQQPALPPPSKEESKPPQVVTSAMLQEAAGLLAAPAEPVQPAKSRELDLVHERQSLPAGYEISAASPLTDAFEDQPALSGDEACSESKEVGASEELKTEESPEQTGRLHRSGDSPLSPASQHKRHAEPERLHPSLPTDRILPGAGPINTLPEAQPAAGQTSKPKWLSSFGKDTGLRLTEDLEDTDATQKAKCNYVCVDNLGGGIDEFQLLAGLEQHGVRGIQRVKTMIVPLEEGKEYNGGWGFIEFKDLKSAQEGYRRLEELYLVTPQSPLPRPIIPHWPRWWPGMADGSSVLGHISGLPVSSHFAQPNSIEFEHALRWRALRKTGAAVREHFREDHMLQLHDTMLLGLEDCNFRFDSVPTPPTETTPAPSRMLWLRKLPEGYTQDQVAAGFEQWGGSVHKMLVDPITFAENGQALVLMDNPDQAARVVTDIEEMVMILGGSPRPLEASVAHPGKPRGSQALYNSAMKLLLGRDDSSPQPEAVFIRIKAPTRPGECAAAVLRELLVCQAAERAMIACQMRGRERSLARTLTSELDREFRKLIELQRLRRAERMPVVPTVLPQRYTHLVTPAEMWQLGFRTSPGGAAPMAMGPDRRPDASSSRRGEQHARHRPGHRAARPHEEETRGRR